MSNAIKLAEWAEWFCRNVKDPEDFRWKHMAESAAELRLLQAEVERLRANLQPSVPDGWKLVPVEPTPAMIDQLRFGWSDISTAYVIDRWKRTTAAAAPHPSVVEQEYEKQAPVVWYDGRKFYDNPAVSRMNMAKMSELAPLYRHPQNLNCKSTQARLATLWGYVKEQPKREPLTDEQEAAAFEAWWRTRQLETFPKDFDKSRLERWGDAYKVDARKAWFARAVIERSHGIE